MFRASSMILLSSGCVELLMWIEMWISWSQPLAPAADISAMPAALSGGGGRRLGRVRPQDGFPPPSRSGRCLKPDRTISAPVWVRCVADGL